MKMTRKLIPALVMLLVSAIMLSTASFAWFASNNMVTADGMNVKVVSSAAFLQISDEDGAQWSNAASAKNKNTAELNLVHATIGNDNALSWYTAGGLTPGSSAIDSNTKKDVTANLAGYARVDKFKIRMSEGSQTQLTNIVVGSISVSGSIGVEGKLTNALRVLVVGSNGVAQIWSYETGEWICDNNGTQQIVCPQVPDYNSSATITVYTYLDGESEFAFTDNATAATISNALSVTVTFTTQAQS